MNPGLDDHLPALAYHYASAVPSRMATDKAVEYATRAGDHALAQLAHDEAVAYYRQALDLLAEGSRDETRRLELLILLGEAQRRAADPAHRQTLLDAAHLAHERGDPDALTRAALANNRGSFSVTFGVDTERVAVLEAALKAVGPADSPARARLLANLAAELTFAPEDERRQELATEALAIAHRVDQLTVLGHVLATRHAVVIPIPLDEHAQHVTELDALAAKLNDPTLGFWAAAWGGFTALTAGDLTTFKRRLRASEHLATELGQPSLRWAVAPWRSNEARIAGDLAAAKAFAQQALQIGTAAAVPDAMWLYLGNLFGVRYDQGRLGDLVDPLRPAVAQKNPLAEAVFALALCELDQCDKASQVFEALAANEFTRIPRNFAWLFAITVAAEVCATLGDAERADVLYKTLAPHHDLVATCGAAATTDSVAQYLGLLATITKDYGAADGHFAAAADTNVRMQAPIWLARTHLEWARMLLARRQPGDIQQAHTLLDQALATARRLGLGNVERRAAALLH